MELEEDQERKWNALYSTASAKLASLDRSILLFLGFNTNVDVLYRVNQRLVDALGCRRKHSNTEHGHSDGWVNPIKSVEDVCYNLVRSMKLSAAKECFYSEANVAAEIEGLLGSAEMVVGGQAGNMALDLAQLGFSSVLHAISMSAEQRDTLLSAGHNILLACEEGGELQLVSLHEAAPSSVATTLRHHVFEYASNEQLLIGIEHIKATVANRFISSYDPFNSKLAIDEICDRNASQLGAMTSGCILAGAHMLDTQNWGEDGVSDSIDSLSKFMRKFARGQVAEGKNAWIHVELASTPDEFTRHLLVRRVLPFADSIGLNEQELEEYLATARNIADCDTDNETAAPAPSPSVSNMQDLAADLLEFCETLQLRRCQLHTHHLHMTAFDQGCSDLEECVGIELMSLLVGATVVAEKASHGDLLHVGDGTESTIVAVSPKGRILHNELLEAIGGNAERVFLDGTAVGFKDHGLVLLAVPTLWTDKPVRTVGMGDAISASAFATRICLEQQAAKDY